MQKQNSGWHRDGDWRARYSKLYSSRQRNFAPEEKSKERISFMIKEETPYTCMLAYLRASRTRDLSRAETKDSQLECPLSSPIYSELMQKHRGEFSKNAVKQGSDDLGGHETELLDMVRACTQKETEGDPEPIPKQPIDSSSDEQLSDFCIHGMNMRNDRSMSRSRFSRMSTRRDMDIPSILAYTATDTGPPIPKAFPVVRNESSVPDAPPPRWSIRRHVCPVCSQQWRDRTSITNVKYSGLKRSSSIEMPPSVIAPARLRSCIKSEYVPRPALAPIDEDSGVVLGAWRSVAAAWLLTRARRYRVPKLPQPQYESMAASNIPLAQKDIDNRVHRFLCDAGDSQ